MSRGVVLTATTLTPAQCRMARAALQWSLDETAKAAGISYRTIFRLENEQRDIQAKKVAAIRCAFEAAGVRFVEDKSHAGVLAPVTAAGTARKTSPKEWEH